MKIAAFFLMIIFALLSGCKTAPVTVIETEIIEEEEPPESPALSDDEIKIINETINHILSIITRELKNSKDDMQMSIDNEFYIYMVKSSDSYEADLANSEKYLKNNLSLDNEMLRSFIKRNAQKRIIDKDVKFKADFFWKGEKHKKNFFKLTFSNIGFDNSGAKAIIHVYVDLPGWVFTEYVYLEKTDEDWKYVSSLLY